ncbi:CU044_5270 family protein [Micromonospora sp. R77]|uniref:CU044_5270 family protein n=1 Tax=Micromonospora sp. R77 TaxID=2925836 RepID=UPI001F62354E|nr:CU044_5270 family protein [Micromonospora sp. R77]MCI4063480.1 CU044_5270 family protein [Micromonospora sp. R77]
MRDLDRKLSDEFSHALADLPTEAPPVGAVKLLAGNPAPGRRGLAGRRLLAGFAVATAVVAGVVVAPSVLPLGGDGPSSSAAAAVLNSTAAAAERAPAPPVPGPDQFVYYREIGAQRGCGLSYELWQAADGKRAGRVVRADGVKVPGPDWHGDPAVLPAQKGCRKMALDEPVNAASRGDWDTPTAAFVAELPTGPGALYERALRDATAAGSEEKDQRTFEYLAALLWSGSPYLTPQLRATVMRALSRVPGIQKHGSETDALGRRGIAIGGPLSGDYRLILDPRSGQLLGTAGALSVVRTTSVVDSTTERPTR